MRADYVGIVGKTVPSLGIMGQPSVLDRCIVCCKLLLGAAETIEFEGRHEGQRTQLFFRVHPACWVPMSVAERDLYRASAGGM